jgi:hypothetical protein
LAGRREGPTVGGRRARVYTFRVPETGPPSWNPEPRRG